MQTVDNNAFMILNSIIYKIHTNPQFMNMRKELLEQLKLLFDFDSAEFHLSKGDGSPSLVSRVGYNCETEISQEVESLDYSQGILSTGKSMVYRESDLLPEKTRIETQYYQTVYKANHWHYALQLILAYDEAFLGVITFYRQAGKEDFKYSEIFLLEMLKEHLAFRIYRENQRSAKAGDKITVAQAVRDYGLTKREQCILELMMQSHDNGYICDQAMISNNTLKKHILNIYRKLNVNSRIQLFRLIQEHE